MAFSTPDSDEGAIDIAASAAAYVNKTGRTEVRETVTWWRVRYTAYGLVVVNVSPSAWGKSTMLVRAINEDGTEIGRFALMR